MSINANELRLGSWVIFDTGKKKFPKQYHVMVKELYEKDVILIDPIGLDISLFYTEDSIKPIPLTPEILAALEFELKDMMFENTPMIYWRKDWMILFKVDESKNYYMPLFNDKESELDISVSSLHQLQNLYFSLTGTELIYQPLK